MTRLVFPDPEALAQAAAEQIARAAVESVEERGRFVIAVSGGRTPLNTYRLLAQPPYLANVPWAETHVLWADERWVPVSHPESNERAVREALLERVPVSPENVHPMYREMTPAEGAEAYESEIAALLGDAPLDLALLGMGADGHTASLFPGDPSTRETERRVAASRASAGIADRLTLTSPLLCEARSLMLLVTGADKADALREAVHGEDDAMRRPAGHIARCARNAVWWLDRDAAQRL